MAKPTLPFVIAEGYASVMGVELRVRQLSNGMRVIDQDSLAEFVAALARRTPTAQEQEVLQQITHWHWDNLVRMGVIHLSN